MASQITNFQCPACTGPLHFEGASGNLACDYCGSHFTVQEIEALYGEKIDQAAQAAPAEEPVESPVEGWDWPENGSWDAEQAHLKSYSCPSCGAGRLSERST